MEFIREQLELVARGVGNANHSPSGTERMQASLALELLKDPVDDKINFDSIIWDILKTNPKKVTMDFTCKKCGKMLTTEQVKTQRDRDDCKSDYHAGPYEAVVPEVRRTVVEEPVRHAVA